MKPLTLLYPEHCMLCRENITEEQRGLCPACRKIAKAELCSMAGKAPDGVDKLVCAARYQGKMRRAVIDFKFKQRNANARPLAELMAEAWEFSSNRKPDLITYVPISALRTHARGFNQSEELAKLLAARWDIPVKATLRRKMFSRRQSNLHAKQRWDNAKKAFLLRPDVDVSGKHVLLVDDIVTTGATICTCAALLREMGAEAVWVVAAAKTC